MKDMIKILYKDDTLVVAVKPVGVLSQKDRTGEPMAFHVLCHIVPIICLVFLWAV